MDLVLGFIVSLIPALFLYLWLRKQKLEDESYKRNCTKAFIAGMMCAIPVGLCSLVLNIPVRLINDAFPSAVLHAFLHDFIVVALSEEVTKQFFCKRTIRKYAPDASWLDTVIYMTLTGLGFAVLEAIPYALTTNVIQMIVRGITLGHCGYGFVMGYYMGKAKKTGKNIYRVLSLLIPFILHGLYDACLSEELNEINEYFGAISMVIAVIGIVLIFMLIRFVKKHRGDEKYTSPLVPAE